MVLYYNDNINKSEPIVRHANFTSYSQDEYSTSTNQFFGCFKRVTSIGIKNSSEEENIFILELIKNNSVSIDNLYIKGEEFQEKIDFYRDLILPVNIANLNCQYHQDVEITDETIKLFNEMKLKIINIDLINSATPNEEESKFDIVKVISSLECENLKVTCKTTPLKDLLFTFESAIIKLVKISDGSIKFLKCKLLSCSLKNSSNNTHCFRSIRVNSEDQSILFFTY